MTEEEIKEIEETETVEEWTLDDLVALTDEVQQGEVDFRGKVFKYQFCELVEKEEPKFKPLNDSASEEQKMAYYSEIGSKRVWAMIEKASVKNPDGPVLEKSQWDLLPTTLRYSVANEIMGTTQDVKENFQA
tara:strand:- start:41 stop:436 length:396 start_codon:yes stop_codon:yes gene_type:complete